MTGNISAGVAALASEIEAYLVAHPDAADTCDGIARWWLQRRRLEESVLLVEQAVEHLLRTHRVRVTMNSAGISIYSAVGSFHATETE